MNFTTPPILNLGPPDEFARVNRLIIIGNGFDLAHGLKSSFKDFVDDYFMNSVTAFFKDSSFEDELIKIHITKRISNSDKHISELTRGHALKKLKEFMTNESSITLKWNSKFFELIAETAEIYKWVDIETLYFKQLSIASKAGPADVTKINTDLESIKTKLCDYLGSAEKVQHATKINFLF